MSRTIGYDLQCLPRCCKASDKSPSSPSVEHVVWVQTESGRKPGPTTIELVQVRFLSGPRFLDSMSIGRLYVNVQHMRRKCPSHNSQVLPYKKVLLPLSKLLPYHSAFAFAFSQNDPFGHSYSAMLDWYISML